MSRKKDIEVDITDSDEKQETAAETPTDTPDDGTTTESEAAIEVEELSEEEKLRLKVAELEDRLLRAAAEFDNYKKRQARNYDDMVRNANDRLLLQLLEVVDNFERAVAHGGDEGANHDAYREGTELILSQMHALLDRHDVAPIEALGEPFDPNLHEALMQVASDEYEEGVVAMEVNRGYKRGGSVLRHARVGVSTGPEKSE